MEVLGLSQTNWMKLLNRELLKQLLTPWLRWREEPPPWKLVK
jgi:hypothetical protein